MKTKSIKIFAVILSAFTAISTGAVFNAAALSTHNTAVSESESVSRSVLTDNIWNVNRIVDSEGNTVNPYQLFGSSFRLAHQIVLNNNGTFAIYLGATNGTDPCGTYTYDPASAKLLLKYKDGFNAAAYLAYKPNVGMILQVPVTIHGNIYTIDFALAL